LLFAPAQVVNDENKMKHTCRYVDINITDLWELIPEFSTSISFNEFKATIFKLYPGLESKHKWIIANMDKPVGEQLQMGILNTTNLRTYYQTFYTITQFLLTKNHIFKAEQDQAFIKGFQLDWCQISHRLK
jgi:hypothetical protein